MSDVVHILLIEDDPQDAVLFIQLMETNRFRSYPDVRYDITTVTSMNEAVEVIGKGEIGVVVVDLLLRGSSSNDILALIENASRNVPIVALTTDEGIDAAVEAIKHGAQDYLVKGWSSGDVIDRAIRYAIERKKLIEEQNHIKDELIRSNAELQQFAYVASHDLREPLRMVTSYLDLLKDRYEGKMLDEKADEYIGYAVDGASRMQQMIDDLLSFSRIDTQGRGFEKVDMNEVVATTVIDLGKAIEESGATVADGGLPSVLGDKTQLTMLMENLVGNAIKFRGAEKLLVEIEAKPMGKEWVFSVKDNGIGIDVKQLGRLFEMFQRGHSQDDYPGTGIGLAISRKIVERHGGRIWVESTLGGGSTFYFTIPQNAT